MLWTIAVALIVLWLLCFVCSYMIDYFTDHCEWDKMPGQKEASYGVVNACVTGLEVLIKK